MGDPALIPAARGHNYPDLFMQTSQLAHHHN
jgi:hypothetical protein